VNSRFADRWCERLVAAVRSLLSPGPRMVDELECVASVLLAIVFGHLADARNISWAAYSGYMLMRGHISESLLRGVLRIVGTVAGALLALGLVPLVQTSPAASAAALALVGGGALYGALTSKRSYAWLFVGLTFAMVLLDKLENPKHAVEAFASTRIREIVAGTAACVLVSMVSTLTLRRRWPGPPQTPATGFGWRPEAARHAGQGAVALAILPFIGAVFWMPELSQSAISIMAVMLVPVIGIGRSGLIPVSRRIILRVAGCASGAAVAAATLFLAHTWEQAVVPVLIAGAMLGVVLGRHIENGKSSIAYAGTQFTLAILVILVPDSYARADLGPGVARLTGILVGILVLEPVLVVWHLVAPAKGTRQHDEPAEPGDV
jgi:uncharacterized membrane protein YccC